MAFTVYRSTDVSAPALSGEVGTLIAVLDACLVTGYGTQIAAGWTKAFADTNANKAVYRNGAASLARRYLQINDGLAAPNYAYARGYATMANVDSGTDPFPNVSQKASGLLWHKSSVATTTQRGWILIADDRTFTLAVRYDGVSYLLWHFGDGTSYVTGDLGFCLINGGFVAASQQVGALATFTSCYGADTGDTNGCGIYIGGTPVGPGSSIAYPMAGAGRRGSSTNSSSYSVSAPINAFPNIDGSLCLNPIVVAQVTGPASWTFRGEFRGVYDICHPNGSVSEGDTFGGTGLLAGKLFRAVYPCTANMYSMTTSSAFNWAAAILIN